MGQILLLDPLTQEEVAELHKEFPQYQILHHFDVSAPSLLGVDWAQVEVVFSSSLSSQQLKEAHQLRWIHLPHPYVDELPLHLLNQRQNILITNTKGTQINQMGEFALAATLMFGKQLLHWKSQTSLKETFSELPSSSTWHLKEKTFLQVGLGMVGTEVTRRARELGMRVWGIKPRKSFHPYCDKVFALSSLHNLLPAVDVLCFSLPRGRHQEPWFGRNELNLMKEDSVLMDIGGGGVIDLDALAQVGASGKFRGIVIDTLDRHPPGKQEAIWDVPNLIFTPNIAPLPSPEEPWPFRVFRYNLRQYIHGNYNDMQNLVRTQKGAPLT